jgi:hypothetical protein
MMAAEPEVNKKNVQIYVWVRSGCVEKTRKFWRKKAFMGENANMAPTGRYCSD